MKVMMLIQTTHGKLIKLVNTI